MAFSQLVVKNYPNTNTFTGGAGLTIPLSGKTAGAVTSAAGLQLALASTAVNAEWDSLMMVVNAGITTTSLVVQTVWQVSQDNTNWFTLYPINGASYVAVAPTGTGTIVTTTYFQSLAGVNVSAPYIRPAVINTGATGAAGDNVIIGLSWRKRWTGA